MSVSSKRLQPAPAVHTRLFDGELVILDLDRGEYLALDAVGSALWKGIEGGRTVAEIAQAIVANYDVTIERATADLEDLLRELISRGLFVEVEEP